MEKSVFNLLIDRLKNNPDKWEFGRFTLKDNETGIELWQANIQPFDLDVYAPHKDTFTLLQKFKLHSIIKKLRSEKLKMILNPLKTIKHNAQ